jgi:ABC-type transport system involved in cytochrome bd biosynthesis fused ATPase/permease subunit
VALARALYSSASLLLLDDIFSAVDTKTSVMMWNRVFASDLLQDRTVLLVTQLEWVADEADVSDVLDNGRVQAVEQHIGRHRKPKPITTDTKEDDEKVTQKPKTNTSEFTKSNDDVPSAEIQNLSTVV